MLVRRLEPGDDDVVLRLATYDAPSREHARALLGDRRTIFLVAFDGDQPAGFVLAYELLRRHGHATSLFVYEVETHERYRRRGVATALLRRLAELARERGIPRGFVLTEAANEPAMRLYKAVGGRYEGEDAVWTFEYAHG